MQTSQSESANQPAAMDIAAVDHGSAAVATATAALGSLPQTREIPSPGRPRSKSRTPDRGRAPSCHVISFSPSKMAGAEYARKRRAASLTQTLSPRAPLRPLSPPPASGHAGSARPSAADATAALSAAVLQMQQRLEEMNHEKVLFEANLLKRLDDYKEFAGKSTKVTIDLACQDVLNGIEAEFTRPERFKAHLRGRDEPIFESLFDELYQARINNINVKIEELQYWVMERTRRDAKVESYLAGLERDLPGEGATIKMAFQSVMEELILFRANAAAASPGAEQTTTTTTIHDHKKTEHTLPPPAEPSPAHVPLRTPPGYPGTVDDLVIRINELQYQLDAVKSRCHCEHVDYHEVQIQTLLAKPSPAPTAVPTCSPCNGTWDPWQQSLGKDCPEDCQVRPGHCKHVVKLMSQMEAVEDRLDELENADGDRDEWADSTIGAQFSSGTRRARRERPVETPFIDGPLGQLIKPEVNLFDDKLATQAGSGFRFDGQKGGATWMTKVGNYFVSKCPAARVLLTWAGKFEGESISHQLLMEIASKPGSSMTPMLLDSLNNQMWGFISNCVSSEADTIFKGADDLQGLDAWRRIVKYIDHGKSIKLEQMRREMKTQHLKPIKNMESIAIGIAEFELRLKEYAEIGGSMPDDEEKKADLLNILPGALRESLLWRATDPGPYAKFRDMVLSQAARSLLQQQRLPLHRVEDSSPTQDESEEESNFENMSREDLLAFVKKGGGNARVRRQPRNGSNGGATSGNKAPRKCPNCCQEHKELKCPHPPIDVKDRPCWKCWKKGHVSKNCTEKLANVNDERRIGTFQRDAPMRSISALNDGFSTPKKTVKPMPQRTTINDFVSTANRFSGLSQRERKVSFSVEHGGFTAGSSAKAGLRHSLHDTSPKAREQPSPANQPCDGTCDEIECNKRMILNNQKDIQDKMCQLQELGQNGGLKRLNLLERSGTDNEILGLAPAEITIVVAADSGAVTHVIHPNQLPAGCVPTGANNDHFTGAGGEHIERFGEVDTILTGSHSSTKCAWDCADVSRALHSIAKITGPADGEGNHEVLFTNRRAVVVPAGFVEKILEQTSPILEYNRVGNLYLAEVKLSSFARQGQQR